MSSPKKIPMNLIKGNYSYLEYSSDFITEDCDYLVKEFESLDEVVVEDGVRLKRTKHDYEITPDAVNSYADGTNYRLDPSSAVRPVGRNLGDIASIQELLQKSPQEAIQVLASLFKKVSDSKKTPAESSADSIQSEVK